MQPNAERKCRERKLHDDSELKENKQKTTTFFFFIINPTLTVQSLEQEEKRWPRWEKAKWRTWSVCSLSVWTSTQGMQSNRRLNSLYHDTAAAKTRSLFEASLPQFSYPCDVSRLSLLQTWVSGHRARYAVVAVEQLPPKELISGDGLPLSAGQTGSQHSIIRQTHEDLQHQAVWQNWDTLHPDILSHRQTHNESTRVESWMPPRFSCTISPNAALRVVISSSFT